VLSAILYGSRISLLVGVCFGAPGDAAGRSRWGCCPAIAGGRLDAFIMRVADVQLSFPPILIALLIDGVARAVLPRSIDDDWIPVAVLVLCDRRWPDWVQYARTVRGSTLVERNKEYVQAARVIGVRPLSIMRRPCAAQRAGPGAGHRDDPRGHRDHHRGDAVVPRRGRAAHARLRWAR
jgi:peptide/nickel transport system permease protein